MEILPFYRYICIYVLAARIISRSHTSIGNTKMNSNHDVKQLYSDS